MKKFILSLLLASNFASAQAINGNLLYLRPGALPTICRQGEVRVNGSGTLEVCNTANTWGALPTQPVGVASGGTGLTTITAHGVMLGEGTSNVATVGPGSTSGAVFVSQGVSADPVYSATTISSAGTITVPSGQLIKSDDGNSGAPGLCFASEPTSGWYRAGTGDIIQMVGGLAAMELIKEGTNVNVGIGTAANASAGAFLTLQGSINGQGYTSITNTSSGTSSSTSLIVGNGPGANVTTVENWANNTINTYLGGGSALFGGTNQTQLIIGSEYASGFIGFDVGGRTLAKEAMRLGVSGTGLTLNKGWGNLTLSGSTSGALTLSVPATVTTGTLTLPGGAPLATSLLSVASGGAMSYISSVPIANGGTNAASAAAGTVPNATSSSASAWTATPTLGASGTTGTLSFNGSSSGTVTIQPAAAAGTYNFNLPITAGSPGQVMASQGGGSTAMTWINPSGAAPTKQYFNGAPGGGSQTGYLFIVSGITTPPTAGATYTNNSVTYTVIGITNSNTLLWASLTGGTAASLSGTTLTKSGGTGDATITFGSGTSQILGTYTVTSGSNWIKSTCVGAGGGGGGAASAASNSAAGGGAGGGGADVNVSTLSGASTNGGLATGGDLNFTGGISGYGITFGTAGVTNVIQGYGGSSAFSAGGSPGNGTGAGNNGTLPGGGGSGGAQLNNGGTKAGGNGATGACWFEEFTQ